ncbi:hypothetical protein NB311A_12579 [Nitrobacter sp. Nb-311A]|uniref:hypothetical protein n=1 Tax=unclassified Nitrobacter TaxID=2620411 RepID=UPI0000684C69|nr:MULTISPECIES: hypothetical protein [unclassified Nitrobacter]EAQ35658.1 hypothetical protein NB311A_12579 [Nitrobacter sp. Nb-311A]MCB1391990.1 hypothetical protein [Nitrobacter sp.]MCV0385686.1 hypothetical protein [Nitrobacter sp.]
MVTVAEVAAALAAAEAIVNAIIKVAPAIEQGVASSMPYVQAIAGLIGGSNATADEIDAVLARINAEVDEFLRPLPPDDGSTTT